MVHGLVDFRKIFRRKAGAVVAIPLRIEGVRTRLTPEPDEKEVGAMALLEMMRGGGKNERNGRDGRDGKAAPQKGTAEYYRTLSEKIREAHAAERRMALRCIAYTEQELALPHPDLAALENGLFRHITTIEREKGDLKERWQHCLADITVRQMRAVSQEPMPDADTTKANTPMPMAENGTPQKVPMPDHQEPRKDEPPKQEARDFSKTLS